MIDIIERGLDSEISFSASRSSGPGGQNVNKLNTRIELRFNIPSSKIFTDDEKEILLKKLKSKVTHEGDFLITVQDERSQIKNKQIALTRFYDVLREALKPPKKRKKTYPSEKSVENRLKLKKIIGEKKKLRRLDY